ncbi:5-formyltetrahydrofolate cyclo-ligase [Bowmanella sp. Y26]|uniref:5-formyltetrahydrofolate cyclo-ligase n=1 Tax=Bowmanella yangjiangensis TaxID=2811230 RepID=UPI001BDDB335|nr:5-formyltetrahydrofolate cyclo-ligase [Bowmanella yangjiangensis]MBT1064742.1 5-formyltetrahydrofolate cyclo-ligase [Bowmanella yangjiangensis]
MSVSSPNSLRQHYRACRNALSLQEQRQAANCLVEQCKELAAFQQATRVALYLANDGELNPCELINHCWQQGKAVYLPVLHPFTPGNLVFVHYHPNSPMIANKYGIAEPRVSSSNICPLPWLDIVFTPLVAFDKSGNRMGMGGGYYDRTLRPVERDQLKVEVIGLAHNCQQCDNLPVQPWDIPMHKIITPGKIFHFQSR